jgi:hypothetical protein
MLYARMSEKATWPLVWEEVQDMHKYLNKMSYSYQLVLEKKMLASQYGHEYRGVLIKWGKVHDETKRVVLLETGDPEQMRAALFMLINEAEQERNAAKNRVSMVP